MVRMQDERGSLNAVRVGVRNGAVALLVVLAGCTGNSAAPKPTPSAKAVATPIVINGDVDEVLTPAPDARAPLTAREAWVKYTAAAGHPQQTVPGRLRVLLGRLALPPQLSNRLVWAYGFGPIGCVTTLPQATPSTGIQWTFVDARTGRMLEETCQRTG